MSTLLAAPAGLNPAESAAPDVGLTPAQVLALTVKTMTTSVGYGRQIALLEMDVMTHAQADLLSGMLDVQVEAHAVLLNECPGLLSNLDRYLCAALPTDAHVDPYDFAQIVSSGDEAGVRVASIDGAACDRIGAHFLALGCQSLESVDMDRLNESSHARDYGWFTGSTLMATRFYERVPEGVYRSNDVLKDLLLNAKTLHRMADVDPTTLYDVVRVLAKTLA